MIGGDEFPEQSFARGLESALKRLGRSGRRSAARRALGLPPRATSGDARAGRQPDDRPQRQLAGKRHLLAHGPRPQPRIAPRTPGWELARRGAQALPRDRRRDRRRGGQRAARSGSGRVGRDAGRGRSRRRGCRRLPTDGLRAREPPARRARVRAASLADRGSQHRLGDGRGPGHGEGCSAARVGRGNARRLSAPFRLGPAGGAARRSGRPR